MLAGDLQRAVGQLIWALPDVVVEQRFRLASAQLVQGDRRHGQRRQLGTRDQRAAQRIAP